MTWKCIICEKEMEILHEANDPKGILPNIDGGTISIDFGYGSKFDDLNGFSGTHCERQGCICDLCFRIKEHLTRKVIIQTHREFVEVKNV